MKPRMAALILALAPGLAILAGAPTAATAADAYKVDPVHSTVIFRIKHLEASYAYGRFDAVAGTFTLDEQDPTRSAFDLQVKADSVDTNDAKRDQHLKGADYFNVKQFPTLAFKSKSVKKSGANTYDVAGDLTMHGVTKPVSVKIETTGPAKKPAMMGGGYAAGFEAQLAVKRGDFGMKGGAGMLGDDVRVIISVEGGRP